MTDAQITFATIAGFLGGILLLAFVAMLSDLIGEPRYYQIRVRDGKYFVRGSRFRILWQRIHDGNAAPHVDDDWTDYYTTIDAAFACVENRKNLIEARKAKPKFKIVRDLDVRDPFTKDNNGTELR